MEDLAARTAENTEYLKNLGHNVVEMRECEWLELCKGKAAKEFLSRTFTSWSEQHPGPISETKLLEKIRDGSVFGLIECDIRVPPNLYEKFAEFPPIFKNALVGRQDICDIMQDFAEKHDFLKKPRKMLIGSMIGEKLAHHL